ncbi:MAG: septal ring lytic transglycosylase RlpA family protein [Woeseiaceae bacterium]
MPARLALLAALLVLGACGGSSIRGDGPPSSGSIRIPDLPDDPVPRPEPLSRYGNGPDYEVFGKRYTVMPTSANYQERGVASWYGKKFHGRLTSNREPYDMYQMTAAHKSLPLPTYVRVRNLKNNRSVIVRVNDRGPFAHNRIIDLSYAAAIKLDMIRDGTSLVEVTAINFDEPGFDEPGSDRPTRQAVPPDPPPSAVVANEAPAPQAAPAGQVNNAQESRIYVQVGAFGDRANAERRLAMLWSAGINDAFIYEDHTGDAALLRVRIGPVNDVLQYDLLVKELETIGITDPYLFVE